MSYSLNGCKFRIVSSFLLLLSSCIYYYKVGVFFEDFDRITLWKPRPICMHSLMSGWGLISGRLKLASC